MEHPVEIEGLRKSFYVSPTSGKGLFGRIAAYLTLCKKEIKVLDSLDLRMKKGEIYGLLGTNGSGKTTLIRILSTIILPDGGKILIKGLDVTDPKNRKRIAGSIGVMLGERSRSFYWRLTARQNMEFYASLYSLEGKKRNERIEYLLDFVGLGERKDDCIYNFSTGMVNRLAIARAFLHSPDILFFDEFVSNLDPKGAYEIREVTRKLAKKEGKAILLTTHNAFEAESLCDRVGVLHRGKIIAEGSPRELKKKFGSEDAKLVLVIEKMPRDKKAFMHKLEGIRHIREATVEENILTIRTAKAAKCLEAILRLARSHKAVIQEIEVLPPSLENVFINIVGESND